MASIVGGKQHLQSISGQSSRSLALSSVTFTFANLTSIIVHKWNEMGIDWIRRSRNCGESNSTAPARRETRCLYGMRCVFGDRTHQTKRLARSLIGLQNTHASKTVVTRSEYVQDRHRRSLVPLGQQIEITTMGESDFYWFGMGFFDL